MDLGGTTWLSTVPVVLVTVMALVLPGAVATRLAGIRGLAMVALAPGVTVTTVVAGGVVASFLGLPWNPLTLILAVILLWLAAALAGRFVSGSAQPSQGRSLVVALIAVALAFFVVVAVVLPTSGSPEAFPQHPDTIFHLGAAQWMLDREDISTLHVGGFTSGSGSGFYPGAWHSIVVTVSQLTHASVVVSSSCLALVTAGIIWPLTMVLLARTVFGPGPGVTVAAAVTAVAFSPFPYLLMGAGVVWPNLFGQALLPAALACVVVASRLGSGVLSRTLETSPSPSDRPAEGSPENHEAMSRRQAAIGIVVLVPGLAVSHPNAFIALVVLGYLVLAGCALGFAWHARRDRPRVAGAVFIALIVGSALLGGCWLAATAASRGMRASGARGPEESWFPALIDTITFGPRGATPLWALTAVVVVGAGLILLRGAGRRWVVTALILTAGLYFLSVAVDSSLTRHLTWPWYNYPPRLAALMVLPASLAATAALSALSDALVPRVRRIPAGQLWVAAMIPTLVLVLITSGNNIRSHRRTLEPYFHPSTAMSWASDTELLALQSLAKLVPTDAVVAENAWNGGSYMYIVSGRHMLFPTEKAREPGDRKLLALHLDDVGTSPDVCAAARRQHVQYAITGGRPFAWARKRGTTEYKGVDAVGTSDAFRKVASEGPYTLYKMVACAT